MREKSVTSTSFSDSYSMLPNSERNSGLSSTITGAPSRPWLSTTTLTRRRESSSISAATRSLLLLVARQEELQVLQHVVLHLFEVAARA